MQLWSDQRKAQGFFCIVWFGPHSETREALVADLPREVHARWEPGDRGIARLEMVVIPEALVCRPQYFPGATRSVVYRQCGCPHDADPRAE